MRLFVAHQVDGRTRLRAAVRPVDIDAMAALVEALGRLPEVEAIDARPTTGSLVIEHPELAWDDLAVAIDRLGGEIVEVAAVQAGRGDSLAPVRSAFGQVDGLLGQVSAGGVDMRALSFVLMFALAVRQMMQGQVMVPAMSFLWYAVEILRRPPQPPADEAGTSTE